VFCDYDFSAVFGKGRLPAKAGTEPCGSSAIAGQGRLPARPLLRVIDEAKSDKKLSETSYAPLPLP